MKLYIYSLGAGLLVGIVYSLLGVRSPAPPMIALIGLAGMLVGEQVVPTLRQYWQGHNVGVFVRDHCVPQVLGTDATHCAPAKRDTPHS